MSSLHVAVPPEAIDQAASVDEVKKHWDAPIVIALADLTGQEVDIDSDGERGYIATIGQGAWTLVIDLQERSLVRFLDGRWNGKGPGKPFAFDIDVPGWIVKLVESRGHRLAGAPR